MQRWMLVVHLQLQEMVPSAESWGAHAGVRFYIKAEAHEIQIQKKEKNLWLKDNNEITYENERKNT